MVNFKSELQNESRKRVKELSTLDDSPWGSALSLDRTNKYKSSGVCIKGHYQTPHPPCNVYTVIFLCKQFECFESEILILKGICM